MPVDETDVLISALAAGLHLRLDVGYGLWCARDAVFMVRRRDGGRGARGGSWWWSVLVIVVPVVVMTAAAVLVLSRLLDTSGSTGRLEVIRTALAMGAGTGAVTTLVLARRRQWASEHDASERRLTELYVQAIEQLGADKAAVRHGALYALERVAQDNIDHRQTVVDVLCAYLRAPFTPPPEKPGGHRLGGLPRALRGTPTTRAAAFAHRAINPPRPTASDEDRRQEREVRATAQRILQRHLNPGRKPRRPVRTFWRNIDLDLTEATLVNFDLSDCHIRTGRFTKSTFTGDTEFRGTRFTSNARFDEAQFEGDTWLDEAEFEGDAWFDEAEFEGDTRFTSARFEGDATFDEAKFADDARFTSARFEGDATFNDAQFAAVTFNEARFASAARFTSARFRRGTTFNKVRFERDTWFDDAQFDRDTRFDEARFRSDTWFDDARFAGVTFEKARFERGTRFDGARFAGLAWFMWTSFSSRPSLFEALLRVDAARNAFDKSRLPNGWTTGPDHITMPSEEGTWARIIPVPEVPPPAQSQRS